MRSPRETRSLHCLSVEASLQAERLPGPKRDAATGEIVVALVDDEEATLKRLRRKGNSVALEAANPAYETRIFPPDRVRVQGRLVGLLRKY